MPSASTALASNAQPTRQSVEVKTRSAPNRVTGKLSLAIDLMIEQGLTWDKAAIQVKLTVRSMRLAMQRPHVIRFLRERREVFRSHASAGNIRRLVQMRDQDENKMAVVQAIKALEQIGEDQSATRGVASSPGMVIVVVKQGADAIEVIPSTPMRTIEHDPNGREP